jgi:sulfur carrier protein
MRVQVNGESRELPEGTTVAQLVADLNLSGQRLAIEVNEELVPRSTHAERRLADGDQVEVVHAIGGG